MSTAAILRQRLAAAVCDAEFQATAALRVSFARGTSPLDLMLPEVPVEGAGFTRMPGLGHLPMTENPDRFPGFLLPLLGGLSEA